MTFAYMEFIDIQDIADPGYTRKVSRKSFDGWPKSKAVEGARLSHGGRRTMIEVTPEVAERAKAKQAPKLPEVVERIHAAAQAPTNGQAEQDEPKVKATKAKGK